jgi:hypothetical protein
LNCFPPFSRLCRNRLLKVEKTRPSQPWSQQFRGDFLVEGGIKWDRATAPDGVKRRFNTTRRINCPFKLYGKRPPDGSWELQIRCPTHIHDTDNFIGHPQARQLTNYQVQDLSHMVDIGTQPRDILALLREKEPSILMISRDIYNKRQATRHKKLGGKSPV